MVRDGGQGSITVGGAPTVDTCDNIGGVIVCCSLRLVPLTWRYLQLKFVHFLSLSDDPHIFGWKNLH